MLGFVRGMFYGGLASVIALGAASIAVGPPAQPDLSYAAPSKAAAPETGKAPEADSGQDADVVTDTGVPAVPQPVPDSAGGVAAVGEDTAPVPETGAVGGLATQAEPAATGTLGQLSDGGDAAVGRATQSDQPATLTRDSEATIDTAAAPTPPTGEAAPTPEVAAVDEAGPQLSGLDTSAQAPAPRPGRIGDNAASDTLSISTVPIQPQAPQTVEEGGAFGGVAPEGEASFPSETTPEADSAIVADTAEPAQPAQPDAGAEPEAETTPAAPQDTEIAAVSTDTDGRVSIGTPGNTLTARAAEAADTPAPEEMPLNAYAAAYDAQDGRPLMSIILIDDGADLSGSAVGPTALATFPYPLTFAVPATLPDAQERMRSYRERGFEVLAMVTFPEGAGPQDAETVFSEAIRAIPEAVGVIEDPGASVQSSRPAADQLTDAVLQTGHGLVLQSQGLNTVQNLARKAGVPAAVVFRDFDSAGQTPTVMRRFLDQAAFRAGQEEDGVIMMGRVRPDTISALLLWGLQDRASRVALAPVSTLLKALPVVP